jgi:hypothetical protein
MNSARSRISLNKKELVRYGHATARGGKSAMARYVAQLVEITHFRLTRPFRVAYTRLIARIALSGAAAPIYAAGSPIDGRNL